MRLVAILSRETFNGVHLTPKTTDDPKGEIYLVFL